MQTRRTIGGWARARAWVPLAVLVATTAACAPPPAKPAEAPKSDAGPAAFVPVTLAAPVPDDPSTVALTGAIRKVTVFSDRALVTREAATKVTTEPGVYAFRHLPGWVDEGSVRASASAGRILDVRVSRSYLARASDPGYHKAESEARELGEHLAALDDELAVLAAQVKQVEDVRAFSQDKVSKDVTVANLGIGSYASVVEYVSKTLRDTAKARRAALAEREQLAPEIEAARRRVEELKALTQIEETTVYVTLQGQAATDAAVTLTYMLPGATWEPVHELRVTDAAPTSAEVTSFAVVTQASGEDWTGVDLAFSTQSSTAAVRIPELEALTLGDTRAATQMMEQQSASFSRAEAAFRGQNRLWNKHLQTTDEDSGYEEVYKTNFEALQLVQAKTVQIFQSLQQRGTTAQLKALSPTNVRADGRSVRVPIGKTRLGARQVIVAAPEQSLNAALTLEMRNESGQPLLPGNVALYQDGAFLGMTNLEFVADGESFSLFLSVADQLKLSRALDKKHSALVRKTRTQMQLAFVVTVENLSQKPVAFTLADRVPVSEEHEIVISGVKITPDAKPDSKGILRWPLTLQPKETRKVEIQYQIEYPPTLVLEMRRNQTPQPTPAAPRPGMAMPAPAPAAAAPRYDLKKDIERLEAGF
jgi:uncharacterized protein (TIGR02231 family)